MRSRPDTFSFNMVMSALERSKKWRLAIVLFEEMRATEVPRDEETYAALILACVSGKQWARGLGT